MKPDSPFSKLPSLSDLLGHPTVAQVVKRVNQTTIAQRATGFLEELQSNLRHRLDQGQIPSLGQLAERFARRLLGPAQTSFPAVNATGTLLGERWPTLPLAEPAIDELVRLASEYQAGDQGQMERVNHVLRELTSAEAALVVSSVGAAAEMSRAVSAACDISRYSGFINPQTYGLASLSTITERLQNGAELVVADGAGLIGGPPCGIIAGKRDKVDALVARTTVSELPTNLSMAALGATLAIYQSAERVIHRIPIWQLLTTPLENLEQRCQRLATLIDASERIISATPTRCDGIWCDTENLRLAAPSWAIVVKPRSNFFDACLNSLNEVNPKVLARVQRDEIWLDLRGVFPRWDQHLVAVFD
jgi:hypothetical protein